MGFLPSRQPCRALAARSAAPSFWSSEPTDSSFPSCLSKTRKLQNHRRLFLFTLYYYVLSSGSSKTSCFFKNTTTGTFIQCKLFCKLFWNVTEISVLSKERQKLAPFNWWAVLLFIRFVVLAELNTPTYRTGFQGVLLLLHFQTAKHLQRLQH